MVVTRSAKRGKLTLDKDAPSVLTRLATSDISDKALAFFDPKTLSTLQKSGRLFRSIIKPRRFKLRKFTNVRQVEIVLPTGIVSLENTKMKPEKPKTQFKFKKATASTLQNSLHTYNVNDVEFHLLKEQPEPPKKNQAPRKVLGDRRGYFEVHSRAPQMDVLHALLTIVMETHGFDKLYISCQGKDSELLTTLAEFCTEKTISFNNFRLDVIKIGRSTEFVKMAVTKAFSTAVVDFLAATKPRGFSSNGDFDEETINKISNLGVKYKVEMPQPRNCCRGCLANRMSAPRTC